MTATPTPTPIKVLVVDDSVVVRRLVSTVLDEHADIEVIGAAANGQIAIDKMSSGTMPDVVALDMEMPVMDGIETLREIRRRWPRLPVVMFSTLTAAGATATLDALSAGASDFVTKPSNVGSVSLGMQAIREQLVPKLRVLAGRPAGDVRTTAAGPGTPTTAVAPSAGPTAAPRRPAAPRTRPPGQVTAVVIGVSTGGPNALAQIWPDLSQLQVPVLLVQHMPPVFTAILAKRLDDLGTVPMREGEHGGAVVPGAGWMAPGDHHMTVHRTGGGVRLQIDQSDPVHSCRPAVDPLLLSAAAVFGSGTLAVILTGMGTDGAAGAHAVREAGGTVIAQDEPSSVVWGMPGAVVNAGLADAIVPLDRIAAEISQRCRSSRPQMATASSRAGAS
jgi:two-component system chemotaxis response regulator CheB